MAKAVFTEGCTPGTNGASSGFRQRGLRVMMEGTDPAQPQEPCYEAWYGDSAAEVSGYGVISYTLVLEHTR